MQPFHDRHTDFGAESGDASRLSREHGHALKNIFSIIIANAEMIAEEMGEGSLVKRRLERIVAASHRGEELVVSIRREEAEIPAVPGAISMPGVGSTGPLQGRILVVDDEPDVLEIICRYLVRVGLEVHALTESVKALEYLRDDSFSCDLVLTDLEMPLCSGAELCRTLHALQPELPVIVMTGYGKHLTPEEMEQGQVKALLCKPIDRRLLIATISRLLSA